jgi:hypothetical protein
MAHQQRAEIFALPFAFSAFFCGYSVLVPKRTIQQQHFTFAPLRPWPT